MFITGACLPSPLSPIRLPVRGVSKHSLVRCLLQKKCFLLWTLTQSYQCNTGYLGEENKEAWANYDATLLLHRLGKSVFDDILIDVGTADSFFSAGQLLPEVLQSAAQDVGQPLTLRLQDGYDHSYYFVSTFLPEHIAFHAQRLQN